MRKAAYVQYAQAVPLKYAIDSANCIYFQKGKCRACEKVCPTKAVDFTQKPETVELNVGSVVIAAGFKPFDPSRFDSYNYANYKNVITSMEFERMLSASGPSMGHVARPSDHKDPKKIAWFQCVGSRDLNKCDNPYCSAVCCMYAIKEAVIAKEHAGAGGLDCSIFFMDMRTHGKDFEVFYEGAKKQGVRFVRSRVHTITEDKATKDLSVRYVTEDGALAEETFDMIVLSIGLETPPETVELAKKLGLELTSGRFAQTGSFTPVSTSREGVFVCGAFAGPKDIPQSVVEASASAVSAGQALAEARGALTKTKEAVPETDLRGEPPRIGVFVCRCGINIAGVVDVPSVVEHAKTLPGVVFATDNMYSCSQDTQDTMAQIIRDNRLNRVVVAACTPKTHEPLFQETLINAGLNKYLFEMANIRNQDSWVHKENPEAATQKAKDLVRMGITKAALIEPLPEAELDVNQTAMVAGGGISGMSAALALAGQGYETHIVERSDRLGGQALNLHKTWRGEDIQAKLAEMVAAVTKNPKITVHLGTEIAGVDGFVGNFKSALSKGGQTTSLDHGVAVVATGAGELRPSGYAYGKSPRIVTSLELDKKFMANGALVTGLQSAVFIQCVGSREPERPYCSRVCCTHSIESALEIKRRNPDAGVYILYRDIRSYGERETLYRQAREAGVIFIRYSVDRKPVVEAAGDTVGVTVFDPILGRTVQIGADLLCLASAVVPNDNTALARFFKVPVNAQGFFVERHAKLGPSEFATDGVFLCGLAHYPKPIDESIAQGQAAASRAITLLARKKIRMNGQVAKTNPALCSSCGVCVSVCPYKAPSFTTQGPFTGKAEINPVLCKGCGLCVASCRSGAINLKGFDTNQIMAMLEAM